MNKTFNKLLLLASLPLCAGFITACSDDDDPQTPVRVDWSKTPNTFDADGIWSDNTLPGALKGGPFSFSHSISDWGTVEGFTLSKSTDTKFHTPMYEHSYTVMTGGGPGGVGTPFVVGFWSDREGEALDARSCAVTMTDGASFTPGTVYVTNTCYAYYTMRDGSDYSEPFADGDWFLLTAHGVKGDGTETAAEFYLARCGANPVEGIVGDWREWDLSPLGEVMGIYFTMSSSDVSQWGMNTPAYFALSGMSYVK